MLETLTPVADDPILALAAEARADVRPGKVDLGVGVWRDAQGRTPVMAAIRTAEAQLLATQDSKSYLGMAGDAGFVQALADLVLVKTVDADRLRGLQTPGGAGALRLLCEVTRVANPGATVWVPDPTWPVHGPIALASGLAVARYPVPDLRTGAAAMLSALQVARRGDVVIVHASCQNPTGIDPSPAEWAAFADLAEARGLIPLVDLAYAGFGDGITGDTAALRMLAARLPEVLLAVSCSKSFGLYRERVGAAYVLARSAAQAVSAAGVMAGIVRCLWSMPPDHGAACVRLVLHDPVLRREWETELEAMRRRLRALRAAFSHALSRETGRDWSALAHQRGMFSRLPLSVESVNALRHNHAIYLITDGRMNFAGLPEDRIDSIAAAIGRALT